MGTSSRIHFRRRPPIALMDREGGALALPLVSIGTVEARQSRQARPFRPTDGG
jgi:hypothetical protein